MLRPASTAVLVLCALSLTACDADGGSTASASATESASAAAASSSSAASGQSNVGLTQAELLARLKAAVGSATAVAVAGSTTATASTGTASVSFDLQLDKDGSSKGSISTGGMTIPMILVGGVTYFQVSADLEQVIAAEAGSDSPTVASELVVGKWVSSKSAVGSSLARIYDDFLEFDEMTESLASTDGETITYLGTATVDGRKVARYKDVYASSGSAVSSTLDLPATGSALPVEIDKGTATGFSYTWDQPTTITAPAAAEIIDLPSS